MTSEERAWLLISRAVSGEISAEEREEMELIFQRHPELHTDYENIKKLRISTPGLLSVEERRAMERGLEKFDQALDHEHGFADKPLFNHGRLDPLQRRAYKGWMIAASLIGLLMIGVWGVYHSGSGKTEQPQILTTNNGKRIHTILPDGSSVWLNSGSSVKYTYDLNNEGKREVTLLGEAYFDVKHDIKHPFIVHAGKLNVVVLGTAFNVKAYYADSLIETTLIRGKVEILNEADPGSNIVLYPNEKIIINTAENTTRKAEILHKALVTDSLVTTPGEQVKAAAVPDEAIEETAWLSNKLTFKEENFKLLAARLERWYNVKIVFVNDKYASKQFTGTFKNQDINEVMHALQLTQPFHYKITANQIRIW